MQTQPGVGRVEGAEENAVGGARAGAEGGEGVDGGEPQRLVARRREAHQEGRGPRRAGASEQGDRAQTLRRGQTRVAQRGA